MKAIVGEIKENKKALVIGAGIAGLAIALRLKSKGYEVTVIEANAYPGGKISNLELNGYRFDTGPSLLTMPNLIDELFSLFNENPKDFFNYRNKDTICNYFWEDGTRFSAAADKEEFINDLLSTFQVSKYEIENYLEKNKQKYELTSGVFLEKSLHKISTYLSATTLKAVLNFYKLDTNRSLNATNKKSFRDQKLVQLFNRFATYNGSSPYKTPGIMSMIPHLEMQLGTFTPKGGMKEIALSLYALALKKGVQFKFNEEVTKITIDKKAITGLISSKSRYEASLVVSNSDIFTSYSSLLKDDLSPKKIVQQERSSSAIIFYWGIRKQFPELDLHNILFSSDYEGEFDLLFNQQLISSDPTVYINISSKEESADAPEGSENWFVMINTPANFNQDWDALIVEAKKNIINKINSILKIDLEPLIECESILDPRTIESKTKSHRGSLYGASSNSKFAAFLRHPNFTSKIKGLYFCGGSVHPGGGIPLSLLSAKIVSDLIDK
jgi:phytoene desaturase